MRGFLMILATAAVLYVCGDTPSGTAEVEESTNMEEIQVPVGFRFDTRIERSIRVQVLDVHGVACPGVGVKLSDPTGDPIASGFTAGEGWFGTSLIMDTALEEILVEAPAVGVQIGSATVPLVGDAIEVVIQ